MSKKKVNIHSRTKNKNSLGVATKAYKEEIEDLKLKRNNLQKHWVK